MIGDIDWAHPLNRQHPMAVGAKAILLGSPNHRGKRWYDLTANRNHGTLVNMHPASDWVPGPVPGTVALDLDGVNDEVTCSIAALNGVNPQSQPFTIVVRAKWTSGTVLARDDTRASGTGTFFPWASGSQLAGRVGGSNAISGVSVDSVQGRWASYAIVNDTSTALLCVDGVQVASLTPGTSPFTNPYHIGRNGNANQYAGAQVAEFLVYDRALSSSELRWLHDNPDLEPMLNKIEPTRKWAPVSGGGGGFNPAWAMNSTVVAGVNCA